MPTAIQSIFRDITPYLLARDLGLDIYSESGEYYINHPSVENAKFWLKATEFVSSDDQCDFIAGNIFDFMAVRLGDYMSAYDFLLSKYRHTFDANSLGILESHRPRFLSALHKDRDLFLSLFNLFQNLEHSTSRYIGAAGVLTQQGIAVSQVLRAVAAAKGKELNAILHGRTKEYFLENATYLVYPFFNQYHVVASVQIQLVGEDTVKTIHLSESRQSFMGLHTVSPIEKDVYTLSGMVRSLQYLSRGRQMGKHSLGVVFPLFGRGDYSSAACLQRGTFVLAEGQSLETPARTRGAFISFFIAYDNDNHMNPEPPGQMPWLRFVGTTIQYMLQRDNCLSLSIKHTLDECRYDSGVAPYIQAWLIETNNPEMAEAVKTYVQVPHTTRLGNMDFSAQPNGYFYKHDDSTYTVHLTNFTLRMHNTIWFEETKETYHFGTMYAEGIEIPFKIDQDDIIKADSIVRTLNSAVKTFSKGSSNFQPIIYDRAGAKHLVTALSAQLDTYACKPGIGRVGWNSSMVSFNTPAWRVSISNLDTTLRQPHPSSSILPNHYSFIQYRMGTSYDRVSPRMKSYIALLASAQARLFLNLEFQVVSVRNSQQGANLLNAIFLAFNQLKPVELNTNKRREVSLVAPELSRIPVYGYCSDPAGLPPQPGYIFTLSFTGATFYEPIDDETSAQIMALTYQTQTQLLLWMIDRGPQILTLIKPEPFSIEDYIAEGKRFIEEATTFKQFDALASPSPELDRLLSSLKASELGTHFRKTGTGLVELTLRKLLSFTRNFICRDLNAVNVPAEPYKKQYIRMDYEALQNYLNQYYGEVVTLPQMLSYNSGETTEVTE